ncbi:MAG: DUF1273 family protein, partial [Alistipes sp.]|nr:DUF1273 family protein [Alistipes sp.]
SSLYERGYRRFLTGMAWGFDLAAAQVVISLKNSLPGIELIAVEPYPTFRKLFHGADAELYDKVKGSADLTIAVGERGEKMDYIRRNDFLVENSSIVIAWWSGTKSGGTAYTIRKARLMNVEIRNLYNKQLELFVDM